MNLNQHSHADIPAAELLTSGVKIGITGAAGSGKSTFSKFLCDGDATLLHDEGVREWLADRKIPRFKDIDPIDFCELHLHLLSRYKHSKATVFDRTPADLFHYASVGKSNYLNLQMLEQACISLHSKFDLIIIFPMHTLYFTPDFAREDDIVEHMRDAGQILDVIKKWDLGTPQLVYDQFKSMNENKQRVFQALIEHKAR